MDRDPTVTPHDGDDCTACTACAEHLGLYALDASDDALAEHRTRVEAHLDGCAACRQELETLRATARLVRDLPRRAGATFDRLDSAHRAAVIATATSAAQSAPRRVFGRGAALAAAAALVLAVTLIWAWKTQLDHEARERSQVAAVEPGESNEAGGARLEGEMLAKHLPELAREQRGDLGGAGRLAEKTASALSVATPSVEGFDGFAFEQELKEAPAKVEIRERNYSAPAPVDAGVEAAIGVGGGAAGVYGARYGKGSSTSDGSQPSTDAVRPVDPAFAHLFGRPSRSASGPTPKPGEPEVRRLDAVTRDLLERQVELRERTLARANDGAATATGTIESEPVRGEPGAAEAWSESLQSLEVSRNGAGPGRGLDPSVGDVAAPKDGSGPVTALGRVAGGAAGKAVDDLALARDRDPAPGATPQPAVPAADAPESAPADPTNAPATASSAPAGDAPAATAPAATAPAATAPAATAPAATGEAKPGAGTVPVGPTVAERVDEILSRLDRRPGETPQAMFFRYWGDNPFVEAKTDPLSTFSVDVDTASYTLARKYLNDRGVLPPAEAIRTEEFVNFFRAGYAPPAAGEGAFRVDLECVPSVFAHEPEYRLLRVGVKAREVSQAERKPASLVFVVDTSGSMRQGGRLELVKDALRLLVAALDEGDSIAIVAFDRESRLVLEPADAAEKERILSAIATLQPNSNTNLDAGLTLGYRVAASALRADTSNRVILLSDGVANTGHTEQVRILANVENERQRGIFLTTVGVGMDNHNDQLLEQLADRGNGQCVYVDRIDEARRVFVENLTGTLETVAKDVKIQVEFDPERVLRYRQLGYENRAVADADFRNNAVDAGEVGAGHEVTALYEVRLAADLTTAPAGDASTGDRPIATVRVRYLTVDHGEAVETDSKLLREHLGARFDDASAPLRLHACVAELAEVLRDSFWSRGSSLAKVADRVQGLLETQAIAARDDLTELVALMRRADALVGERDLARDQVAMVVDALKENRLLRARVEDAEQRDADETRRYLDDVRAQNDELRRRLERLLTP